MNKAQIQTNIRKQKAEIKRAANRANRILAKYPDLQKRFASIMEKARQQKQLGATPWFQMPVESFSGMGSYAYTPPSATPQARRLGAWGYGAPGAGQSLLFAENTPSALSSLGQDQPSWFDTFLQSDFTSDLLDFGQDILTHERIAADEQKQIELEIQKIQAQTEALEKQTALQEALERSGTFTRSVQTTLAENPMAIPLLLGLGGLLIFMQTRK